MHKHEKKIKLCCPSMIIVSDRTDEFEVDIYNTSEKMSTYLIAFVVCDFEYTETVTRKGVKVNI